MVSVTFKAQLHGSEFRAVLNLCDGRRSGQGVSVWANLSVRSGFGGSVRTIAQKAVAPVVADLVYSVVDGITPPGILADALEESECDGGIVSTVRGATEVEV